MSRTVALRPLSWVLVSTLAAVPVVATGDPLMEPQPLDLVDSVQQRLMESAARGEGRITLDPSELPGWSGATGTPPSDGARRDALEWERSDESPALGNVVDSVPQPLEEAKMRGEGALAPGEEPDGLPAPVEPVAMPQAPAPGPPPAKPAPERKPYVPLPSKTLTIRSLDDLRSLSSEISGARDGNP